MIKLFALFFILGTFQVSASIYSQKNKLSIKVKSVSLSELLWQLQENSEMVFVYKTSDLELSDKVTINKTDASITEILDEALAESPLEYKMDKGVIVIKRKQLIHEYRNQVEAEEEKRTIKGSVKDKNGEPIPFVAIRIKDTTTGTVSAIDGSYSMEISDKEGLILEVSTLGFVTQEIQVNGKTQIDIVLIEEMTDLNEVVVVGYGTQKRKDLTGAVASVNAEKVERIVATSFEQKLQGQTAGVQVISNSGEPGGGTSVRIRGSGTWGNSEPLYVIDGVPYNNFPGKSEMRENGFGQYSNPLAGLNPNDIESIDILKDASSAAIYGVRGANGVVIITTKNGKKGKTKIELDVSGGFSKVNKRLDLLGPDDYITLIKEIAEPAGLKDKVARVYDPSLVDGTTDWQDAYFKTGYIKDVNLNISGGGENATFSTGLGYSDSEGTVPGTGFTRYSSRIKSLFTFGKVKIGQSLIVSNTDTKRPPFHYSRSPLRMIVRHSPLVPVYNPENEGGYAAPDSIDGYSRINPIGLANLKKNNVSRTSIIGNIYAEVEPVKNLKYKASLSVDYMLANGKQFTPSYYMSSYTHVDFNTIREYSSNQFSPTYEHILTYSNTFNDHSLSAMIGYSQQTYEWENRSAYGEKTPNNHIRTLSATTQAAAVNGMKEEWALRSLLSRFTYAFRDKYLMTANIRRDQSSRFASANRASVFPSVSFAWRIMEEPFMKNFNQLSNMKLRLGYGELGNQEVPLYSTTASLVNYAKYPIGGKTAQSGVTAMSMPNAELRWEVSKQFNAGLDLGFYDGKVSFTTDYFIKKTEDLLARKPLASSTGVHVPPLMNAGSVENKGIELSLNYQNYDHALQYSIGVNATYIKNEVTSMSGAEEYQYRFPDSSGSTLSKITEGHPMYSFFGHLSDGIFQTQEEVDAHAQQNGAAPGDIRFKDVNHDNIIDDKDIVYLGDPNPDWTFGFNANASYKNWELSMAFQGAAGVEIYNGMRIWTEGLDNISNASTKVLNRWTGPGTSNSMPRAIYGDPNFNRRPSDRFIENGAYLKCRNITVSYNIPKSILGKTVSGMKVFLTGQNLFTLTDYSGYDPEISKGFGNDTGAVANRGVDNGMAPQPVIINGGFKLTF